MSNVRNTLISYSIICFISCSIFTIFGILGISGKLDTIEKIYNYGATPSFGWTEYVHKFPLGLSILFLCLGILLFVIFLYVVYLITNLKKR